MTSPGPAKTALKPAPKLAPSAAPAEQAAPSSGSDGVGPNPAQQTAKLIRLSVWLGAATLVSVVACAVALWAAAGKKVVVIGATETGRFIQAVALDKPYLNEPRVQAFAEECLRRSFAHDFRNFRLTMSEATECYSVRAGQLFNNEMQPLLADLVEKRMVMTAVIDKPPVVVGVGQTGGVYTWSLQSQVTLHREGTRERVPPAVYKVKLLVTRVPLEEAARGVLVNFISLSPV